MWIPQFSARQLQGDIQLNWWLGVQEVPTSHARGNYHRRYQNNRRMESLLPPTSSSNRESIDIDYLRMLNKDTIHYMENDWIPASFDQSHKEKQFEQVVMVVWTILSSWNRFYQLHEKDFQRRSPHLRCCIYLKNKRNRSVSIYNMHNPPAWSNRSRFPINNIDVDLYRKWIRKWINMG